MTSSTEVLSGLSHRDIRIGLKTIAVYGINPQSLQSPGFCKLLSITQAVLDQGAIMMITGNLDEYSGPDDEIESSRSDSLVFSGFAASLNDAYVFKLDTEPLRDLLAAHEQHRFAATTLAVGAFILSKLGDTLKSNNYARSLRTMSNDEFRAFSHIWEGSKGLHARIEYIAENPAGALAMLKLGELLGKMHFKNFLHGDTHLGNFCMDKDNELVAIDFETVALLLRQPTCRECATDFAGFLPEINARQWSCFKMGYISKRGVEGLCTINTVEYGQELRSVVLFNTGNFEGALDIFKTELEKAIHNEDTDTSSILMNMGVCCGQLGRLEEALSYCQRALESETPQMPANLKAPLIHNLGMAYYRLKQFSEATECFKQICENPEMQVHDGLWMSALWHLSECFAEMDRIEEALVCLDQLLPEADRRGHPRIEEFRKRREILSKTLTRR